MSLYKDYEHEKLKEIGGTEIDKLLKETEEYLNRLKSLREQIDKRAQEKTIEQIYKDIFGILEIILGKKSQDKMIEEFNDKLVKKGMLTEQSLRILKDVIVARKEFKKGKLNSHKVEEARKGAVILINDLVDYSQRKDLVNFEKARLRLKYSIGGKDNFAELIVAGNVGFLIVGNSIKKISNKIEPSNMEELSKAVEKQKSMKNTEMSLKILELVKDELGEFEIVL